MRPAAAGLLALLVAAAAAGRPQEPTVSADGRYGVRFPGRPKESTRQVKTDAGTLTVRTASFATPAGTAFVVVYTDYPPPDLRPEAAEALLAAVRDGLAKDGKLKADAPVAVGPAKLPGREVLVEKGPQRLRYRLVLRGNRLYQVGVVGPAEAVGGPEATAFLDSFEVTK